MGSALPGRVASACLQWALGRSWRGFMRGTVDPLGVQTERLIAILRHNAATEIGRRYGFGSIRSFTELRRRVPVHTYDDLAPAIDRMTRGERNVLTADPPVLYCRTSGTTGTPKHVPITPGFIEEFSRTQKMWLRQLLYDHPRMLSGRILSMVSPAVEGHMPDGTPYGAMTGHSYSTQYPAARAMYALPYAVFTVPDFHAKYYAALRIALGRRISMAFATNPSTLVLLARLLTEHAEALIRDVHDGALRPPAPLPPELAPTLTAPLSRNPRRAAELQRLLDRDGALRPAAVWPDLSLLATWQGGSAPFYLQQLPAMYGDVPVRDLGLIASEGYMTVPLRDGTPGGLAALSGLVMEFQPVRSDNTVEEVFLHAGELEVGRQYAIVLTNSGGLYRYAIGDVVEVLERMGAAPVLAFRHKIGSVLSMTGEKVTETQVIDAMTEVCRTLDVTLAGFTVSIALGETPAYLLAAEPRTTPAMLEAFDRALRARNIEYAAKRDSLRLGPPVGLALPAGAYLRLRRDHTAAGAPDGQWKVPHLVRDAAVVRGWADAAPVPAGATPC